MASSADHASPTLFVDGLPDGCDDPSLRALFEPHGEVERAEVFSGRGFGFVEFRTQQEAEVAKAQLDGQLLPKSRMMLRVRWPLTTSTLCVHDMDPRIKPEALKEAMKQFGDVVSVRMRNINEREGCLMLGNALVEFAKREVAANVQQIMSDNMFLLGQSPRPLRVEFALHERDSDEGRPVRDNIDECPPHFAQPGTLEYDFALKWRELQLAHKAEVARLLQVHMQEREVLRQEQRDQFEHEYSKFKYVGALARGNTSGVSNWNPKARDSEKRPEKRQR